MNSFNQTNSKAITRDIKRRTKKHYNLVEKMHIILEVLRGKMSIAELCRKEGINSNLY